MPIAITDDPAEPERLARGLMQRFGFSEERARDTVLAGSFMTEVAPAFR